MVDDSVEPCTTILYRERVVLVSLSACVSSLHGDVAAFIIFIWGVVKNRDRFVIVEWLIKFNGKFVSTRGQKYTSSITRAVASWTAVRTSTAIYKAESIRAARTSKVAAT